MKYRFAKYVLTPVVDILCSGRAYKYSDILKLDRLVRKFDKTHLSSSAAAWDPTDPQPFARESLLNTLSELGMHNLLDDKILILSNLERLCTSTGHTLPVL